MKKVITIILVIVMMLSIAACANNGTSKESDKTSATASQQGAASEQGGGSVSETSVIEKVQLKNNTITVMSADANWNPGPLVEEYMTARYDLKYNVVSASWFDYRNKLIALVMSGDSPDVCYPRQVGAFGESDDFYVFVNNDLVIPIDVLAETEASKYPEAVKLVEDNKYGGKDYLLPVSYTTNDHMITYNRKIFKENAIEEPWELFKKNEWTWEKFAEVCEELTQDIDGDGVQDLYGAVFLRPYLLLYTTGKTYGEVFQDGKYEINLRDPDIARAMNYVYDLVFVKKIVSNDVNNALTLFKEGKTAMLVDEGWGCITTEAQELAQADSLDMAPLPRDPNTDKYFIKTRLDCLTIPKGAKNVEGAIALYNSALYGQYVLLKEESAKEKGLQNAMENYKWPRYVAEHHGEMRDFTNPLLETVTEKAPFIGHAAVWAFVTGDGSQNWTAYIESQIPTIENNIQRGIYKKKDLEAIAEAMEGK